MSADLSTARGVFSVAAAVLFDFDGPLCDVFAGMPAPDVARRLSDLAGVVVDSDDPLEVLRHAADQLGNSDLQKVENALIAAEVEAIAVSEPTAGGREAVQAFARAGRRVGVVSNNSTDAVVAFLRRYGLVHEVGPVVGRAYARPDLMKPNPWSLMRALGEMNCPPGRAVFIGDSLTDIQAAHSAGVPCVAVANKPGKREQFAGTGALAVVGSMQAVLAAAA